MKRILYLVMLVISPSVFAYDFGAGILLGSPTGFSAEKYIDSHTSIDAAIAWNLNKGKFNIHSNYLIHQEKSFYMNETPFNSYYGAGIKVRQSVEDKMRIGPRGVGGADYVFEDLPIKLFGEIGAIFTLIEKTGLEFDMAVGARYMF